MYYVYVIRNNKGKIYIGQTANLEKRLLRHNGVLVSKIRSYTMINKGKWTIIYKEDYLTRKEALNREKQLKSHMGRDWIRNNLTGALAQW